MDKKTLDWFIDESYQNSKNHGFHDDKDVDDKYTISTRLMLMVDEIAEAHEEIRKNTDVNYEYTSRAKDGTDKPEGFGYELADLFIRLMDLCGRHRIDLESYVLKKMEYNKSRPFKHGKNL